MTLEAVSFVIGGILIVTAIVGGGFEIKEIKMPKVGAVPRFFSLVVGAFFVLIGIGVWEVDRQALMTQQVPVNSFAPATGAAPQEPAPRESAAPERQVAVEQAPVDQTIQDTPQSQAFTGLMGRVRLTWTFEGVSYDGYVETRQAGGFARVAYDLGTGVEEVDQDLRFVDSEAGAYYEGMNPRYAGTQQPHPDYMPDYFRIEQVDANVWAFTQVCSSDVCEPVTSTEVLR
jgi:hypothetical protein